MNIDLHIHSNYSDGSCNIIELLKMAEEKKLAIISITDHDKIGAYEELNTISISSFFHGHIIVGCECKTVYKKVPIEILGYGMNLEKFAQSKIMKGKDLFTIQSSYLEIFKKIGAKIGLRFDINMTLSNELIYASDFFERELKKYSENEQILQKNNIIIQKKFYRDCQCNPKSIFYIDETKDFLKLEEIIEIIHTCKGIAFLAHPFLYPFTDKKKTIEEILKNYNLDGLECEYSLFTKEEKQILKEICAKHKKYISGGSDFHGKSKPNIQIGTGIGNLKVEEESVQEWINTLEMFY